LETVSLVNHLASL